MPNWKKIIVSGSDASLNSLKVNHASGSFSGSFTGSLHIDGEFTLKNSTYNYNSNSSVGSGGETVISSLPTGSFDGAFFEYVILSASNARAGNIMAIHYNSTVNHTEVTTNDIGDTAEVTMSVRENGGNIELTSITSATDNWTVKTIIRGI